MSKYIPDISSHRWVVVSSQRIVRPNDAKKGAKRACPFCPGNEKMTPEELLRYGGGDKNTTGWKLRVVGNKYPITDIHEIIIHSPDDKKDIAELSNSQVELILKAYRDRFNAHSKQGQVIIFCNQGEHAGASIEHPHSQLVVIPSQINLDALVKEPLNNMVDENEFFAVYCPDFSQWPYELWIASKKDKSVYGDITDEEIGNLASILQQMLKRLAHIYKTSEITHTPFGYNFYIYPGENWYLRIIPRFVHRAGFELGTGLSVNIVDPIDAALGYRGIDRKIKNVLEKLQKHAK